MRSRATAACGGVTVARRGAEPRSADARAALAAAERDPRHADPPFHLGNLYREQGRFAAAVAAYEAAAALAPDHPGLRNNLGLAHEGAGDPERAIAAYRAALAAQPGYRQAHGNLAHLLCRLRRYGEATQLCEDYLRRYGDADATIWTDHGICAQYARDLDTALASLERARSLAPNDALILVNLGSVLVLRGDYDAAQEVLAQACALEPSLLYASSLPTVRPSCATGRDSANARNQSGASSKPAASNPSMHSRR